MSFAYLHKLSIANLLSFSNKCSTTSMQIIKSYFLSKSSKIDPTLQYFLIELST